MLKIIKKIKSKIKIIPLFTLFTFVVAVIILSIIALDFKSQILSSFRFTVYALPVLISFLVNLGLLVYINVNKRQTKVILSFSLVALTLVAWSFMELLSRMAITKEVFNFIDSLLPVAWLVVPILFIYFALLYTKQIQKINKIRYFLAIFLPAIIFIQLLINTDLLQSFRPIDIKLFPWGYDNEVGPYWKYFILWYELMYFFALIILIDYYFKSKNKLEKAQIKLIVFGLVVSLVIGTITDAIFPILGVENPPLAVASSTFMTLSIAYALIKYNLFEINPLDITTNILNSISEILIVTGPLYRIKFFNNTALSYLKISEKNYENVYIYDYLIYENKSVDLTVFKKIISKKLNLEHVFLKSNNKQIPITFKINSLVGDSGEIYGYAIIIADISVIYNKNLELQSKLTEIYTLNQYLIGRELKMLDLKKQIKLLNNHNEKI